MIGAADFADAFTPWPLLPHQRRVLDAAFAIGPDGRPRFQEVVYSTVKRSGKSTVAATVAAWAATQHGPGEVLVMGPDLDASRSRVFRILKQLFAGHPGLRAEVVRQSGQEIELRNGALIRAIAVDAGGVAGSDLIASVLDEAWAFDSAAHAALFDETGPILSRPFSMRFCTGYAGISSRPGIWRRLWDAALAGEQVCEDPPLFVNEGAGLIGYIDTGPEARRFPWQQGPRAAKYYAAQAKTLSSGAYARLHLNQWADAEESFLSVEDLERITEPGLLPPLPGESPPLFCFLDGSISSDWTSLASVYWRDDEHLVLGPCTTWKPSKARPILFAEVEAELLRWAEDYELEAVGFDPYQAVGLSQRLTEAGLPMVEVPQTAANQTAATSTLRHAITDRRLVLWPSEDVRRCLLNAVLEERGGSLKLAKPSPGAKIDCAVALSFAVLAALREGCVNEEDLRGYATGERLDVERALRGL